MIKSGHQIIEFDNGADYNDVDPSTKQPFSLGEIVVVCQEKRSLISVRSLVANNYKCPFCLKQLKIDFAASEAAIGILSMSSKMPVKAERQIKLFGRYKPLAVFGVLFLIMLSLFVFVATGVYVGVRYSVDTMPTFADITPVSTPTIPFTFTPNPTATKTPFTPTATALACVDLLNPSSGSDLPPVGKVEFTWEPLPDAASYLLTFTYPDGFTTSFATKENYVRRYMETMAAGGNYKWEVAALDRDKKEICKTAMASFNKPETEGAGGKPYAACELWISWDNGETWECILTE